jgi:hypothetical protein
MAVFGARALGELLPTTLRSLELADGCRTARASRLSRCRESRLAETELAKDHPRTKRLTLELSGHINREAIDWSA